jgi:hypothetical protein
MRFPLIREFTASYRAAPNREEWLRAWHDAAMNVRRAHLLRVIVQLGLTLGFLLSAFLTALHRGETVSLSVAVLCFAGALALGYRHFAEVDDLVVEMMEEVEHPPGHVR